MREACKAIRRRVGTELSVSTGRRTVRITATRSSCQAACELSSSSKANGSSGHELWRDIWRRALCSQRGVRSRRRVWTTQPLATGETGDHPLAPRRRNGSLSAGERRNSRTSRVRSGFSGSVWNRDSRKGVPMKPDQSRLLWMLYCSCCLAWCLLCFVYTLGDVGWWVVCVVWIPTFAAFIVTCDAYGKWKSGHGSEGK